MEEDPVNGTTTVIDDLVVKSFYFALIMIVFCVAGIFGNLLSLIIYSRKSMRNISINVLLIGLSATDLAMLLASIPVFALPAVFGYVYRDGWNPYLDDFFDLIPVTLYPLVTILQTSSVWICTLISAERCMAVCFPLKVRFHCTTNRSKLAMIAIFLFSCVYNSIRFWEYKVLPVVINETSNASGPYLGAIFSEPNLVQDTKYKVWYQAFGFFLVHITPMLLLTALNLCVVAALVKAKQHRRKLTSMETSEHKIAQMMLLVIAIFVSSHVLCFSLAIIDAAYPAFYERNTNFYYLLGDISNTMVVFNSASTFIVYLAFSQKYRQNAKAVLTCSHIPVSLTSQFDTKLFIPLTPLIEQVTPLVQRIRFKYKSGEINTTEESLLEATYRNRSPNMTLSVPGTGLTRGHSMNSIVKQAQPRRSSSFRQVKSETTRL